ncbi:hematopoietic progenitor cell antigen CD34 [Parambassis ranga]|uniref:Hematopoietic progenitor cell antigen CD34 n=1 Tax=Parambassis ranga TaxID=210632 RepID=A0A6P7I4H1_9TELE|nr:hematopoietic progenitor cell antigen CD34 [Parambassis ranga]
MAASSAQRPRKMLAFALLLVASLFNGDLAQENEAANARGDMIPRTTTPQNDKRQHGQEAVDPLLETTESSEHTTTSTATESGLTVAQDAADEGTVDVHTDKPEGTPAPVSSRGDGPSNVKPVPQDDVVCVSKDTVQEKNAVSLKLKTSSNCDETKAKIESVLQELCGEDCKLELYQEDNSDETLVSGKYVEDDVAGMANKFNNDNIKDKTNVEEAVPRWGKNSKLVLVSLLLTGLLLAALLVAGYYLKTHRKNSKGVRLAESFQVDEENQANTLVSVAPLPQEPIDKPTVNGESPPENGTNQAPTTNGHSATQTPVADTEM